MEFPQEINTNYHDSVDELEVIVNKVGCDDFETHHLFSEGMYMRTLIIPKGSFIISKIHKTEHPFILLDGVISIFNEDGYSNIFKAPYVGITYPGARRIAYAEEDCKWTTIHPVDFITGNENNLSGDELSMVLELIEDEVIEPREYLKFYNKGKVINITNCSGIYKIENIKTGDFYIGSSVCFYNRWRSHKSCLNKNTKGTNRHLYNDWKKYGAEAFKFSIVEIVEQKDLLLSREQHWIDILKPAYNICKIAGATYGVKRSEENNIKMREFMKGNKFAQGNKRIKSLKEREKISLACRGSKHPNSKLNEEQVVEIKKMLLARKKHNEIAKIYNVCRATIGSINTGKLWSHVYINN